MDNTAKANFFNEKQTDKCIWNLKINVQVKRVYKILVYSNVLKVKYKLSIIV